MAALMLAHHKLPVAGRLHITSDIPVGKGLASSTADLVATYRAIATCHGLGTSPSELESFVRRIEPSDGVM